MTVWQRRARLFVGVSAIAFAIFVAFQFKHRDAPAAGSVPSVKTDPGVVVATTGGRLEHFELSHQNADVRYKKMDTYADGSSKMYGVTITSEEKDGSGTFTAIAKEALVSKDQSTVDLTGDVRLTSSSIAARTEHATYTKGDNTIRSPGPTELSEGKTSATGIGMTFDREHDVLTILNQAVVHMVDGAITAEVTCGTATFNRAQHMRIFEKGVRMQRSGQLLEADTVVATLTPDDARIDSVDLRENAKITSPTAAVGALQLLTGRNITLKYSASGESIEHAVIDQDALIQLAGERGKAGRQISSRLLDIMLAPDSTPTLLAARENVLLTLPAETDAPERTIRATTLDAKGEPGRGLSRAQFAGGVQYRENGFGTTPGRAVNAATMDVGLKPGLSAIEDARFARAVRFESGKLGAQAAAIRYDIDNGTLELSGSEPGTPSPHIVNERITIDAQKLDVTLDGPKVKATTNVKSILQPAKKGQKSGDGSDVKVPSMLKQDEPVNVLGNTLEYDGTKSLAVYTGDARLFQGETSIKADAITIDDKKGDLSAAGNVTSTTLLKDKEKPQERIRSVASAKDMKYEDAQRRLTYTGSAHLSNRDGDMQAAKIELYLKPSGDELDRAEAYDELTLKEQNRKTTGQRMTYTADNETYVITGVPVTIVDECGRETIGKTLTFLKATDAIIVDGNQQIRTQTKNGGKCG